MFRRVKKTHKPTTSDDILADPTGESIGETSMTLKGRNTTVPGVIMDRTYNFPELHSGGRRWNIRVRLVHDATEFVAAWETRAQDEIPLEEHLNSRTEIPHAKAIVWADHYSTLGNRRRRAPPKEFYSLGMPVYDTSGKLVKVSRSDRNNQFQQAIMYARHEYSKKKDASWKTIDELNSNNNAIVPRTRFYPMLAEAEEKSKPEFATPSPEFPIALQPKLDGNRAVAYKDGDNVILYTRQDKLLTGSAHQTIKDALSPLLDKATELLDETAYFDGELFQYGKNLFQLMTKTRQIKSSKDSVLAVEANVSLQYHVFDCFSAKSVVRPWANRRRNTNWKQPIINLYKESESYDATTRPLDFAQRQKILDQVFKNVERQSSGEFSFAKTLSGKQKFSWRDQMNQSAGCTFFTDNGINKHPKPIENQRLVFRVPSVIATDSTVIQRQFKQVAILWDQEGLILRRLDGLYLSATDIPSQRLRSRWTVKKKKVLSEEFEVVSFKAGTGSAAGAVIFTLTTGEKTFDAVPKDVTVPQRREMYQRFNDNPDLIVGHRLTVEFRGWTEKSGVRGVPFQPVVDYAKAQL